MLNRTKILPCAFLLVLIAAFSAKKIYDRDLGFHLRAGEWMLDHHAFPTTDVFTYGIPGREHVNLYWLFQITQAGLFKIGGYTALGIFQTVMVAGIFWLISMTLRTKALSGWPIMLALGAIVFVVEPRINYRPEIWSWFFLTALIACFENFLASGRRSMLWWIPAIMAVWVNSHALFILGYIVIGAYTLALGRRKLLRRDAVLPIALAAVLAVANPWHVEGALYPFQLLLHFDPAGMFANAVSELSSPWSLGIVDRLGVPVESLSLYYFFFVAGIGVFASRIRHIEIHEWILFAVFTLLSAWQIRNIALFAVVVIPIVVHRLTPLPLWRKWKRPFSERTAMAIWATICLGVTARVVTDAYYAGDNRYVEFGYGLTIAEDTENAVLPFLNDERILNNPNCGNWLAWRLKRPVWITTYFEMMGGDIFRTYSQSTSRGGLPRLIHHLQPDWIIFDHHADLAWSVDLAADSTWHLVAYDARTACFARKTIQLPPDDSLSSDDVWKTLRLQQPNPLIKWLEGFYKPCTTGWRDLARGQFALAAGRTTDAEVSLIRYLRTTAAAKPGVFKDLGLLYYFSNEWPKSAYCLARYLDDFPADAEAKTILQLVLRKSHGIAS